MQTTSSPQSLLSLLSAVPSTQALPDAAGLSLPDEAGFSSILGTLMPGTLRPLPTASPLQALPLTDQALPPEEGLLPLAGDELAALDSVLNQLGFGPVTMKPASPGASPTAADADAATTPEREEGAVPLFAISPLAQAMHAEPRAAQAESDAGVDDASATAAVNLASLTDEPSAESALSGTDMPDDADFLLPQERNSRPAADSLLSSVGQNQPAAQPATATPQVAAAAPAAALQAATDAALTSTEATEGSVSDADFRTLSAQLQRERLEFGADRREWGGALGARIVTMVADDLQQARIHLDPPELGSLEIKLHVQQDQATVQVQAQNPQVRDVLEASAQRLRDALAGQGIQLAGFDVSERGQQGQTGGEGGGQPAADDAEWLVADDSADTAAPLPGRSLNLLDTFA